VVVNQSGQAVVAGAEAGQAVVEYILLISVIVTFFVMLNVGLGKIGFMDLMMSPLKKDFANVYQYGHPKGVEYKPRGGDKTRVFINPRSGN
jgi:hypothetical protein